MTATPGSDLLGIPPTELPPDPAARALEEGDPRTVAAAYPSSCLAWAMLAEDALHEGDDVAAYAYARTGYHRGLDLLRRSGWRGQGPVPWEHEPNQGFLRALAALAKAAGQIGEAEEAVRCTEFLRASSAAGARELGL
ncbi:DUF3151 domain-containing protein [Ornithinimicrobium pratense]|uniref:DUF3151 domain-containing protein n=1 Tax=Ornithinimicrobium pratense TaxID=2593973 RepID=A0A5J6V306_9MICO|nr:DUF3151 domain-containing protein [Ornithinimicrobium pratense]QFG67552.1 DUF3151 domain-containing protein [Ornithinimicrobium pratense]